MISLQMQIFRFRVQLRKLIKIVMGWGILFPIYQILEALSKSQSEKQKQKYK